MSFTQQIGNPNATYPPSLTLAQSANGVGLVSIGSDVKYVTFNPIPSFSWIPLSTNPYENYFFEWYTGTFYDGDYYEGYTPDFATFNALNVKSLAFVYDEPRLSGIVNLDQYPNLDSLDLEYYDGNDISFLFNLPTNLYDLFLYDMPNVHGEQFSTLLYSLSGCTLINSVGFHRVGDQLQSINIQNTRLPITQLSIATVNTLIMSGVSALQQLYGYTKIQSITLQDLPDLNYLYLNELQLTAVNLQNLPLLQDLTLSNNYIGSITLQNFPQLQNLNLFNSQLTAITVKDMPLLYSTNFVGNPTVSITLQNLSAFTTLTYTNNISTKNIVIENLPQLQTLFLQNNQITNLVINDTPLLDILYVNNNNLSAISLQDCSLLRILYVNNNPLSSLVVNNLLSLRGLVASDMSLTYVDVTGLSGLNFIFVNNNLPLSAVNHITVQCDLGGVSNGTLYLQGGTNSPLSGVGVTAANNLIAKGWTVVSNP